MNDLVKELSKEAAILLRKKHHPELGGFDPIILEKTLALRENYDKILAELIIKECIRVPYDMWDKALLNADVAVKIDGQIKDRFGMEIE